MGRFTDPHPFTCSFFTPPFCCSMLELCALPSAFSKPVLSAKKDSLFHRVHPGLQCAAIAGSPGPAFSFSAFPFARLPYLPLRGWLFPHLDLPPPSDSPTTGSHSSNRAGLGLCWYPFPYSSPKIANRAVHGLFPVPDTLFLTFPYGERPACSRKCAVPVFRIRSQRPHTASTGRITRFAGVVPLPGPQNRTQGHTGPSLAFTFFSWCASFAADQQTVVPGGS